jgi:hypothetical protein
MAQKQHSTAREAAKQQHDKEAQYSTAQHDTTRSARKKHVHKRMAHNSNAKQYEIHSTTQHRKT